MNQSSPLVSIVMATYNMENYVLSSVESALAQTYPNIELIVVNDGSTDNTETILQPYRDHPKVKYFYQQNQGQTVAKNLGVHHARGEYIAFLDSDDIWMADKLQRQLPVFQRSDKIGVVYSPAVIIDENGNEVPSNWNVRYHRGRVTNELLLQNFVNFNTSVVKRACFEQLGAFDKTLPMSIDWEMWLRFSTRFEFDFVEQPTIYYRVWSGQMSENRKGRFNCVVTILKRFAHEHQGEFDPKYMRRAWSDTFAGRGNTARMVEKKPLHALKWYLKSIFHDPTFIKPWKGIAKLFLFNTNT